MAQGRRGWVAGALAAGLVAGLASLAGCARPGVPEAQVLSLAQRTERARGLRFRHALSPRLVDAREAQQRIAAELDGAYAPGELALDARGAADLGLLPPGTDLRETILRFGSEAVVGFYAPLARRLYVIGGSWPHDDGPQRLELEGVVVHEMAHALQDQHGRLIEVVLGLRGRDDLSFALGAFLEGEALYVEYTDAERTGGAARPSPEEVARWMSARSAEAEYPDVPRAVREPLVLQYPLGYAIADALVAEGGTARLDAADRDPPLSSEQLLHPDKYLDPARRDAPLFLTLPAQGLAPTGCGELHRQTYGELLLRVWLRERLAARGESDAAKRASAAAEGWGGDRAVFFACAPGDAFAWLVRFDSERDARVFARTAGRALEGLEEVAALAGPPRAERRDDAVLLSAGLSDDARARVLRESRAVRYPDLDAFLAANPQVLEQARAARERARSSSGTR